VAVGVCGGGGRERQMLTSRIKNKQSVLFSPDFSLA
jgi:hypothetical protein